MSYRSTPRLSQHRMMSRRGRQHPNRGTSGRPAPIQLIDDDSDEAYVPSEKDDDDDDDSPSDAPSDSNGDAAQKKSKRSKESKTSNAEIKDVPKLKTPKK